MSGSHDGHSSGVAAAPERAVDWLTGGGEMGERTRAFDWSQTAVGPMDAWPQSLRTAVSICLGSAFPSYVWWGPDLIQFYNDPALAIVRAKHPAIFGMAARDAWTDVWSVIGPLVERVTVSGSTVLGEDLPMAPARGGLRETAYFTFSYSALRDEAGDVAGLFITAIETTARVVTEQRRAEAEAALRVSENRQAFLLRLSDAMRSLTNPAEIQAVAARQTGEYLGASQAHYGETVDDHVVISQGYGNGQPAMVGRFRFLDFGERLMATCRAGRTAVSHDTQTDPTISDDERAFLAAAAIRAYVAVPLVKDGAWIATLAVHCMTPRSWRADEVALVEEVAERTWAAVDRARTEAALRASEAALAADLADSLQLQEVSSRLVRVDGADELYERLVEAAIVLMRADAGSIQQLDREQQKLRLLAWRGFAPESAAHWSWVSAASGSTCGAALSRGGRVSVTDVGTCDFMAGTDDLAEYRRSGLRAVQTTPLIARDGHLVGMLSTHWRTPHEPAERELRLLDVLVRQAADLVERYESERALHESRAMLQSFYDAAPFMMGIGEIDGDRVIAVSANRMTAEFFGRQADDISGRSGRELGTPEAVDALWLAWVHKSQAEGAPAHFEYQDHRAAGHPWLSATVALIGQSATGRARYSFIAEDITDRKRAEAERERLIVAEAVAAERQALLKRMVQAHEAERQSLSRDVHDSVTQLAHAAALRLDDLADRLAATLPDEDLRDLERARDLMRSAAEEARRLIAGLRPETLDQFGLVGALRAEVQALRADGWKATFRDGSLAGVRLGEDVEITLYRVVQEALANVRKHAGKAAVHVELRHRGGQIRLTVRDRGSGFDPTAGRENGDPSQHVGLVGMRERVELLGGTFALRSAPGTGTRIEVSLPLPPPNDAEVGDG